MSEVDEEDLIEELQLALDLPLDERRPRIDALVAEADANDLVNASIFGRLVRVHQQAGGGTAWLADFAWCEAMWNREQHRLTEYTDEMLQAFYMVVAHEARDRIEIPLAQTDRVVTALDERYRAIGRSRYLPHVEWHLLARLRGDRAAAEDQFLQSESAPDDDNLPRIHAVAIDWFAATGRDADAVARYASVIGLVDDATEAQSLHGTAVWPLLRQGRVADAAEAHRRGVEAKRAEAGDTEWYAPLLSYCAAAGELDQGLELLDEWAFASDEPIDSRRDIVFTAHCLGVLDAAVAAGRASQRLERQDATVGTLATTWRQQAVTAAERSDTVNAADVARRELDRLRAELAWRPGG